ncbi:radical SAM protein, partial [candidate division KSB1 bacterium]
MGRNNLGHIYGPVPSRRFGRSLGIDIIPFKICTYDCIYCQLGRTRKKTLKRNQFYDINSLLRELETFLQNKREIDYLTFSGSGEPTLNTGIGEIIQKLKKISDIPVIVLTNGSLLWDKEVRNSLKYADIVVPSMDAVSEETFLKINRPSDGLKISDVLNGLKNFSFEFKGRIFLEIMFVKGINTSKKELKLMKDIIGKLQIDKVHLNT